MQHREMGTQVTERKGIYIRIYGSITKLKDLLASVASRIGTADSTASENVTLQSGDASAGNSGDVTIESGTATGTRGDVTIDGLDVNITADTEVNIETPVVQDDSDATKQVKFDISGATTSTATTLDFNQTTNKTLTFPDITDTVVTKTSTDTLENKTLDASTVGGASNDGTDGFVLLKSQSSAAAAPSGSDLALFNEGGSLKFRSASATTTLGAGLTSLNGETGNTQTFATGTSGTDFAISSGSNTHTFNLPSAAASNSRGLINNLTANTGGSPIKGVTDASSATAGYVGEVYEPTGSLNQSVSLALASTWYTVASITLQPGDWIISAGAYQVNNASGTTHSGSFRAAISTAAAAATGAVNGQSFLLMFPTTTAASGYSGAFSGLFKRVTISAATTYYLCCYDDYTDNAPSAVGSIWAVRIR